MKHRIQRLIIILIILLAFLLGMFVGKHFSDKNNTKVAATKALTDTTSDKVEEDLQEDVEEDEVLTSDVVVTAPRDYTLQGAISVLETANIADSHYQTILDDTSIYPEMLLIDLANNPEMLSFVLDYKENHLQTSAVTLTNAEKESQCPLFLQWDKRWGYNTYGDHNIAISGCGPTALSMVIVGLTRDVSMTPDVIADYAMNHDYYMFGTGTKWKLMDDGAIALGLNSNEIMTNEAEMKEALESGAYLICSMGEGDFTTAGHFIVIYGYDDSGFKVNDPFCIYRSNQSWSYNILASQIKNIWSIKKR